MNSNILLGEKKLPLQKKGDRGEELIRSHSGFGIGVGLSRWRHGGNAKRKKHGERRSQGEKQEKMVTGEQHLKMSAPKGKDRVHHGLGGERGDGGSMRFEGCGRRD